MTLIKGLILDMDGTILDSKQFHIQAWMILLQKYNINLTESDVTAQFGKTTEEIAKNLFPSYLDPIRVGNEKDDIFLTLIPNICPFSGVENLLTRLKQKGYSICIASSNPTKTIQAICEQCNLVVDHCIGMEDVEHGKPAPDMILTAASRLGLPISDCIMVGDTTFDIQAAKAANCLSVGVLTGSQSLEVLRIANPDYILSSITEVESLLEKISK